MRIALVVLLSGSLAWAQAKPRGETSFAPVDGTEPFAKTMSRMKSNKSKVMKKHQDLLNERYDLGNRAAKGVAMFRGKAVQEGVRAKLKKGVTWDQLGGMTPDEVREKDLFPAGFMPLPHPNHPEG